MKKILSSGLTAVTLAAIWAGFDAFVHVRADMVEPLRIAGNLAVGVALAVCVVADRVMGRPKLAAAVCGASAVVVLGLNTAWAVVHGELPAPAAVFFVVAVLLLLIAVWRFLGEAAMRVSYDG